MPELLVIAYEGEDAAGRAREELTERANDLGVRLQEAMVIRYGTDGELTAPEPPSPKAGMKKGAVIGGIAGLLLGGVAAIPGAVIGTAFGGLVNAARGDFGTSQSVRDDASAALSPGTSALLLLGSAEDAGAVIEILSATSGNVIRTTIGSRDLRELEEALAAAE